MDKWAIPKDEVELPADVYSEHLLIIDDGYNRKLLNVPGVMHVECGVTWKKRDCPPPGQLQRFGLPGPSISGRSSGSCPAG